MTKVEAHDPKSLLSRRRAKGATMVVACTLSHEVGWRLRQVASMLEAGPGELVEALIAPTVMAVRLPYDQYARIERKGGPASARGAASRGARENPPVETVPIAGTFTSPPIAGGASIPGGGEGDPLPAPKLKKRA